MNVFDFHKPYKYNRRLVTIIFFYPNKNVDLFIKHIWRSMSSAGQSPISGLRSREKEGRPKEIKEEWSTFEKHNFKCFGLEISIQSQHFSVHRGTERHPTKTPKNQD